MIPIEIKSNVFNPILWSIEIQYYTYFYPTIKKILLISDTHGFIDQQLIDHVKKCDEVWHAGDWGDASVSQGLEKHATVRGVYGNIDGVELKSKFPEDLIFELEGKKVYITHIGGYPGRYAKGVKDKIKKIQPDIFISGHSHICKILKDNELNLLHMNPGAIGLHGFHKKRTMIGFCIDAGNIFDVKVYEYERNTHVV